MTTAEANTHSIRFVFQPGSGHEETMASIAMKGEEVLGFLVGAGADEQAQFAINLAYEELLTNIARHVVPISRREIRVECRFEILRNLTTFFYRDDGPPFNPFEAPERENPADDEREGGMGLSLVRNFFPDLAYGRNGEWNELIMPFQADEVRETGA